MNGRVRAFGIAVLSAMAMTASASPAADGGGANGIYIVGAIGSLHESVESFGYPELERLIEAIDPDVMLLEVRPDELSERKDTPGRPEYPAVVWPMLEEASEVTALPMEPGDSLFTRMVTEAANSAAIFERDRPDDHAFWTRYGESLNAVMAEYWSTLARTQDAVTDDLMRGRYVVLAALAGKPRAEGQRRWDAYMVEQARRAIRANPDKKILVLGNYRNRNVFVDELTADHADRLVDMAKWLRGFSS